MLYFDNAATTLQKPEEVAQAVKESFSYIGNAGRGANEATASKKISEGKDMERRD